MDDKKLNIQVDKEDLMPQYANLMRVSHQKEEFMLDFFHLAPPQGILNARLIVSPGHAKRMLGALQENVQMYEKRFGKVTPSQQPTDDAQMAYSKEEANELKQQVDLLQKQKIGYEMLVSAQNLLNKENAEKFADEREAVADAVEQLKESINQNDLEDLRDAQSTLKDAAAALGEKIHQDS